MLAKAGEKMMSSSPTPTSPPFSTQPETGVTDEDRFASMLAYLSGLIGYVVPIPFLNLVGPCAIYLIYRDESKFIAFHALQALYLHLLSLFIFVGLTMGVILTLGFGYLLAKPFFWLLWWAVMVSTIVLAVKAYQGQSYSLWMIGRWARDRVAA